MLILAKTPKPKGGFGFKRLGPVTVDAGHPQLAGPIGIPPFVWPMLEGAEYFLNDSVSGNNATLVGGPVLWDPTFPYGPYGLLLNGTSQYATMATRIALTSGQTLVAWVKTTSTRSARTYEGNASNNVLGDTTGSVMQGFGITGGLAEFNYFAGAWGYVSGVTPVNDGNWHLIAATYSTANQIRVYVDGVLDGSIDGATYNAGFQGVNVIGAGFTPGDFFNGTLGPVMVFHGALSATQIQNLYREPVTFLRQPSPGRVFFGPPQVVSFPAAKLTTWPPMVLGRFGAGTAAPAVVGKFQPAWARRGVIIGGGVY